jgi:hypothetical protein
MSALDENAVARLTYPVRGTTILSVVSLVAIVVRRRGSFAPNFSASRQALREPGVDSEDKLIPSNLFVSGITYGASMSPPDSGPG